MLNQPKEGCYHNRTVSNDLHYLGVKANMILPSVQAPWPAVCLYVVIRLLGPQEGAQPNSALYLLRPATLPNAMQENEN